ncbi:hypothetical protein [Streptomyces sp. NPDC051909]|uniref:hypothetical protein n=1 Tax=Streptomyces sp. NPDC051909 TaxID=3154944 RepID=UPI00341825E8
MSERIEFHGDVAELLAAIVEALDVPMPSIDRADQREHYSLLRARSSDVRIALHALLRYPGVLDDTIEDIRRWTARNPVTYTPFVFEEREGEG